MPPGGKNLMVTVTWFLMHSLLAGILFAFGRCRCTFACPAPSLPLLAFYTDVQVEWLAVYIALRLVCRLLGRAAFRHKMLARYGTVVTVPYNQGSSIESMAGDIKAAVEAKTGLPLNAFRA